MQAVLERKKKKNRECGALIELQLHNPCEMPEVIAGSVLFVDVQASGSPGNGFLIEVAWKEPGCDAHRFLIKNTGGGNIPPRVKRITGITDEDISGSWAIHPEELKKLFLAAAGLDREGSPALLVAHYAVYEKRWLDFLTGLDLDFLCTRELAYKQIPDLTSGTLRAVAGAAGFSLGERRRALDHVLATEAVFLALHSGFSPVSFPRVERLSLPKPPGVYRFMDSSDTVLYVGKAKNLKNRVNSHFTGKQKSRHAELMSRTVRVAYEETDTALCAAILESRLITEFSPQYNRAGRAGEEKLWYISDSMEKVSTEPEGSSFYGPFSSRSPIAEFAQLVSFIGEESNNLTFVENPWPEIDKSMLIHAFAEWRTGLGKNSIIHYGLQMHRERKTAEYQDPEDTLEVDDTEQVKLFLDGLVESGCLLCRK